MFLVFEERIAVSRGSVGSSERPYKGCGWTQFIISVPVLKSDSYTYNIEMR
jgi:hypothetical protein